MSLRAQNRILAILLGMLTLFCVAALAVPQTISATGIVGAWLRGALQGAIGPVSAWLLPVVLAMLAVNRWRESSVGLLALRCAVLVATAIALATALGLFSAWGGSAGTSVAQSLRTSMGVVGAHLIVWASVLAIGVIAVEVNWPRPVGATARGVAAGGRLAHVHSLNGLKRLIAWARSLSADAGEDEPAPKPRRTTARPRTEANGDAAFAEIAKEVAQAVAVESLATKSVPSRARAKASQTTLGDNSPVVVSSGGKGPADLPPTALLLTSPPSNTALVDEAAVASAGQLLEQRLRDFGVEGRVTHWETGPVITTYEIEPSPGVRVSAFASRGDDLALALRVDRVRIVAPLPGKGVVGVEVPNRKPEMVRLGDVVVSSEFAGTSAALPLPLGYDTGGHPQSTDLTRMPHMLVAGATGAGKSTCINAMLCGLLLKRRPSEMRLVLVDPKMLELSAYAGVPHLLMPVVTEMKKEAPRALLWLVQEMEDRYRLLAARGARNIDSYNASLRKSEDAQPLPYIVLVIDELADLMMVSGREVEDSIARLAQMARAVGIHLIVATQRPSVDVITGVIKANFPSRIAFQVATKVDSRTILDVNGAESLLGKGDMLFLPGGRADPLRVHGAYVSEAEVDALTAWLKENVAAPPTIDLAKALRTQNEGEAGGEIDDDLFDEAARLVLTHRLGSTSFLQRRLKVGYSRAGRLMDLLEEQGIVGPADGSKPREVLLELDEWMARRAAMTDDEL